MFFGRLMSLLGGTDLAFKSASISGCSTALAAARRKLAYH